MQLKNVSPAYTNQAYVFLLFFVEPSMLWSTLFLDIPILAFVSRSRDRIYYNIYVKMTEAAIKGRLHLHLRSATLLLTKDDFPSELLKKDYWEWESSSSP